jgi:4-hydroxyphenylacetate 3-monooxygenase
MRPEDFIADRLRPFTGAEYMESLRDGREVYFDGERVTDIIVHPAFRNSVRSIGRLYDALHDLKTSELLTCPTDTGSGGYTHRYFRVARSRDDMRGAQQAIAGWARLTYGWMGRTPDYKAAFSNTLGGFPEYYGAFADNARNWYKRAQEAMPFMNHAIVNPPIDRHRPAEAVKDVYACVKNETDAGIFVSGAKVVATSAAMTHYNFMGQSSKAATEDPDMSVMFMVPINAPGLKLVCRASYEYAAGRSGSPFDYPLSSRFDENDAIFIMDNVFIPWEDVLVYRDPARVMTFFPGSGFIHGAMFQGCTRYAVKSISSLACWRRRCARQAATRHVAIRFFWAMLSSGAICSGHCRTRWPIIRSRGMAMPCCPTSLPPTPIACSDLSPGHASRISSRRPSPRR